MSLIFSKKLAKSPSEARIMANQYDQLTEYRSAAEDMTRGYGAMFALMDIIGNNDARFKQSDLMKSVVEARNAGRIPADAFREFDSTTKIIQNPNGEFATMNRLMAVSRSVNIGKQAFEYRKASTAGNANTSLSGQIGVNLDHVDYSYAGTVVPIHDAGFGRRWREVEAMRSDDFDAMIDDAREAELTLMRKMNKYMWEGDAAINIKGNVWLGIKNDPTVAQYTLTVDLSAEATTATDIRNEVKAFRDVLLITNNCSQALQLGVSREIMSNWERPFTTEDGTFGTIMDYVGRLRNISAIYEDSELVGNQAVLYWADQQGFHPVVGMALSTYAKPRMFHNSDFEFIKWAAVGFLVKTDFEGRTCAAYAS